MNPSQVNVSLFSKEVRKNSISHPQAKQCSNVGWFIEENLETTLVLQVSIEIIHANIKASVENALICRFKELWLEGSSLTKWICKN
jgi:hypothetical protein